MYLLILPFIFVGLTAKIKNNKTKNNNKFYFELPSRSQTSIQESATNAQKGSLSKERAIKTTSR